MCRVRSNCVMNSAGFSAKAVRLQCRRLAGTALGSGARACSNKDVHTEGEDKKILNKRKSQSKIKPAQSPSLLRSQNNSTCNMNRPKQSVKLPVLRTAASVSDEPSGLNELVLQKTRYPPLMQESSWTLAAPFKEQHHYRNPSDSIANNYTPTAQDLKLKNIKKMKSFSMVEISQPSLTARKKRRWSSDSTLLKTVSRISLSVPAHTPEVHVINYTTNQPLTPEEQFALMDLHEKEISKREKLPSNDDLERYCHYIYNGVREDMLAPQDKEVVNKILKHIPADILPSPELEKPLARLKEEIRKDYRISLMKAIVDYILLDPAERKRLSIQSTPRPFPRRVVCAPVPWHSSYKEMKSWNESNLFIVNAMMPTLQELWLSQYSRLRFVRTAEVLCGRLPLLPQEFKGIVQRHCEEARDILQHKSVPALLAVDKCNISGPDLQQGRFLKQILD